MRARHHVRRPLPAVLLVLATVGAAAMAFGDASATSTRIRSLGGASGFFEDDNNVLRWYGSVVDYADLAIAEVGQFDLNDSDDRWEDGVTGQGGGFHVAFDRQHSYGVLAAYFESERPGVLDSAIPGGAFTALYGRSFGGFAPAIYFRGTSFNQSVASDTDQLYGRSEFHHWLGVGLRADLSDATYLDVAGEAHNTQFDYADYEHGLRTGPNNSWDGWGARARLFARLSEKVVLVPVAEYTRDVRPTFSDTLNDAANLDGHLTRLGIGVNLLPDADNLVLITFEYRDGSEDLQGFGALFREYDRQEYQWNTLEGRVGVESRLLAWLTLRIAAQYRRVDEEVLREREVEDDDDIFVAAHNVFVETPLNLGLGLHFGSFSADLVINDGAPFGFGYALTGAGQRESATFTYITFSYGW